MTVTKSVAALKKVKRYVVTSAQTIIVTEAGRTAWIDSTTVSLAIPIRASSPTYQLLFVAVWWYSMYVTCGNTSVDLIDGSYPPPDSGGIRIRKYYNGYGKVHVTRCRCKQWRLSVRVLKNDICLQKKSPSSFYSSKVIKVFCIGDKSWHTVVLRFVQPFQMKAEMLFGLCRLTSMLIFNRIQVKMLFLVCLVTRWLSFFL